MKKPATMEEYLYLVDQTTFEAGDLVAFEGWDEAEIGWDMSFVSGLEQQLKDLQASITDGSYKFENADLPFMETVANFRRMIPFADMLEMINDTHRYGLG